MPATAPSRPRHQQRVHARAHGRCFRPSKLAAPGPNMGVSGKRYYFPSQGRFLGRDPRRELGGLHLYGFVGNDPTNRWDYLGMTPGANGQIDPIAFVPQLGVSNAPTKTEIDGPDADGCMWRIYYSDRSDVAYGMPDWEEIGREKISCSTNTNEVQIDAPTVSQTASAPAPAGPPSWKPNKVDCDRLRSSNSSLWQQAGTSFASADQAALAASIQAGLASAAAKWEFSSVIYQNNTNGSYSFTVPTRTTGASPAGGGALINNPTGTTVAGLTHGHNIGFPAWAWPQISNGKLPDSATPENYVTMSNLFSTGDQSAAVHLIAPIYIFSVTSDIRVYNPAQHGKPTVEPQAGDRAPGAPSPEDLGKVYGCIGAGY
jgi:hypothetical protein